MTGPLLQLSELGKDFGDNTALKSLTCHVSRGEIVGLLGPNGAGKTTTVKLVLGLLKPTRGRATFDGLDCTRDALRVKERLGYTPDEPAFYDFLTGRETLQFVANVRGLAPDTAMAAIAPLIETLEFAAAIESPVGTYSHGTKKKLALLLAMMHAPALLLLDEPTNGLDPPTAANVRKALRAWAEAGHAVLVSTHLLEMADALCDRMIILNRGLLVAEGTRSDIRASARVSAAASLEDAFLALVS